MSVAPDCPHCEDHFPGEPIVPAIVLLDLTCRLAALDGAPADVASIETLRLRGVVRPGDRLSIEQSGAVSTGASRFRILRGDELLTEAAVVWDGRAES